MDRPRLNRLYDRIYDNVKVWQELWSTNQAWLYQDRSADSDGMTILDGRGSEKIVHRLDAASAEVLLACGRPVSMPELRDGRLRATKSHAVDDIVDNLDALGLIFREQQHLVSLVLPAPVTE